MIAPRRDTRQASLFRLAFGARPSTKQRRVAGIDPYDLSDVIEALKEAVEKDEAVSYYSLHGDPLEDSPKGACIRVKLEDVREERTSTGAIHSYALRFSYLNPMAADRGKRKLTTNEQAILAIDEGEAGEVGAHLLISPVEASGPRAGLSRCALEQMPSLSRSKIVSLINEIADKFMAPEARPTYEYRQGKGRKSKLVVDKTKLSVLSYPEKSESLEDDLENGVLRKLRFLGNPKSTDDFGLDGLSELEQEISATVKSAYQTGDRAKQLIRDAVSKARKLGYRAKADIVKENPGDPHPKLRTRELDLDKEGLADQLYTRQAPITPNPGNYFPELYDRMNEEIIQQLKELIDHEKFWS